ncbi:stage V sporulation protein AA [Bacillus piscicola]|uniref:stage V sporulation protein AA n=1 Tax=Bacillus piscicola TaxID=1632684 RepID=UPI001F093674|nr:stage V sporulation protein AA [Bacillus piscicola]
MANQVYLQLFASTEAKVGQELYLRDIARLEGEEETIQRLLHLPLYTISRQDNTHVVIDILTVLQKIHTAYPEIRIMNMGPRQIVVETTIQRKKMNLVLFCFVWFLLFIGAALAIMNFHEDVSMLAVHQKLYHLVTGENDPHPLMLQIPYSIGLGLGMILFFNHIFKKRINEEPSPLEIEMYQYKQDIEQYLAETETDRSSKTWSLKSSSPP